MTRRRADLTTWTKSSYSAVNGDCVEVRAGGPEPVQVRDSKALRGPVVAFSAETWAAFLDGFGCAPRRH
ncbi:DUF397 domain-containing protein [Streptomyces sp. DSM 42041]|uniref:DUF397 domain-containing protein n=1 Tax=Streptomyces hazeniae TaxID=3075538 RepID=A0ABU2NRI2_9ACTN|nr:DUF397 domain-containing protein [Streptomyces sp. DSM 42041]MDT0379354.1 DUF397 domain-containing protein [Streptomyces sp. DSM 42041]